MSLSTTITKEESSMALSPSMLKTVLTALQAQTEDFDILPLTVPGFFIHSQEDTIRKEKNETVVDTVISPDGKQFFVTQIIG